MNIVALCLTQAGPRNTVGDVPLAWYKDEDHIGYDIDGKKIKKRDREGRIDTLLRNADSDTNWYGASNSVFCSVCRFTHAATLVLLPVKTELGS
jgi:hypothetical protein